MPEPDYIIAIPSYKRPQILSQKTLTLLKASNISPSRIYIFVANKEEAALYKSQIPKDQYNKIVVGKLGITPQRKFIMKYFPVNTPIVSMDDDVDSVYQMKSQTSITPLKDLHKFFITAFKTCIEQKLYLWGIYPVLNPFYMKPTTTYDLKFVLGTFYGFINRHDKSLYPTVSEKEDFEMSILYYIKDGGLVRFNDIGIKTKFHNPIGGLGSKNNRFEVNEVSAATLKAKYPDYGYIWHRKNGMAEFRLARKPRR